jgi:putative ABC transport system ATP-binding protein
MLIAHDLSKTYTGGETPVPALRGVSFSVSAGECVALVGPSGCGKSTLLHLCGAMDRATSGQLVFDGRDLGTLNDEALTLVRRDRVGFVFQFFNLLPTLTLADNIMLPALLSGSSERDAEARARALAERVGIAHRLGHYPQQVSGGELQRAAIARALVHRPALLIADEPTGNLDSASGAAVLSLLVELNSEMHVTMLLATHAPDVAAAAHRTLRMRDGQLEGADAVAAV